MRDLVIFVSAAALRITAAAMLTLATRVR